MSPNLASAGNIVARQREKTHRSTRAVRSTARKVAPLACSIAALLALAIPSASRAATALWSHGAPTSFNWSNAQNWTGNVLPQNGDDLQFDTHPNFGNGNETVVHDLSTLPTVNSISFANQAFTLNASGTNALILTHGISNLSTSDQTINISLTLGANQTWTAGTSAVLILHIGGNVNLGANQLSITGDSGLSIGSNSTFSGTGSILKTGTGALIINSTGGLTIVDGT